MIDDENQKRRSTMSLRELLAQLPPMPYENAMEEQVRREWDEHMEAWYAGLHRDIAVVPFEHACEGVPEGWLGVIQETRTKLLATIGADDSRRRLFEQLTVWATDEELGFGTQKVGDAVFGGICGHATRRSRWVCPECGRRAKRRDLGEEFVGTMCARCVSKPLLRQQIAELRESLPILFALGQPIKEHSVPEYLRQDFRTACDAEISEEGAPRAAMPIEQFRSWVDEWLLLDTQLREDKE